MAIIVYFCNHGNGGKATSCHRRGALSVNTPSGHIRELDQMTCVIVQVGGLVGFPVIVLHCLVLSCPFTPPSLYLYMLYLAFFSLSPASFP